MYREGVSRSCTSGDGSVPVVQTITDHPGMVAPPNHTQLVCPLKPRASLLSLIPLYKEEVMSQEVRDRKAGCQDHVETDDVLTI